MLSPEQPSGTLDSKQVERALLGSNVVAWRLEPLAGKFTFSGDFAQVFPRTLQPFSDLSRLMALLSPADRYVFLQTFNSDSEDMSERVRVCEVRLLVPHEEARIRFIGSLKFNDSLAKQRYFEGVIVTHHHWLAHPSSDYAGSLLSQLFIDSPIAALITDANGILLQANEAFEQLIEINSRRISMGVGHYSLFLDKMLLQTQGMESTLKKVYEGKEPQSIELRYSLSALHRATEMQNKNIYLRACFLPIKNRLGELERVLVQLQDLSRERETLQVLLKQQRELQESAASYKAFIANSSEAIWCYDISPPIPTNLSVLDQVDLMEKRARLSQGNKVLVNMLRASSLEEILGMKLRESGSSHYVFDLQYFIENNYQMADHDIIREDGKGRHYYYQISCVGIIENSCLSRVWGTTKDITVRRRYEQRLEHVSMHDALTGLPNRANIYREIEQFYEKNDGKFGALLFIDLDRFKEINDTLGHQVGDHLLQLIGPRIATEMGDVTGTIARMGGDEFAIFLPDIGYEKNAVMFAHRILDALRLEFDLEVLSAEISASIGIALAPLQANDVSALMRYADVAMYYAKEQLSGIAVYSAEIDPHSAKRLQTMSELGRAIREDQLFLQYQPKVCLVTKRFYGFEALVRWRHPEMGIVPPNDFIPLAEMTSLIHPLTSWVLEKAIAQCCAWRGEGMQLSVAVNLSARNLLDEHIPKLVRGLLQKYSLPPSALELEITESSIMSDPHRAMHVLQQLHELGVQLSIDDFGTGYSSLAYLKKLPVQTLKIDFSFIRNMLTDREDELIVASTIHLAHSLSLKVVAEGVENAELIERLNGMGCDEAQGYHIGRPMGIEQVTEWMKESPWST